MISGQFFAASLGLAAMLVSSHAFASLITQNTSGTLFTIAPVFEGESFTMPPTGGPWDNITFNFFSDVPATSPFALGTAYLLSEEYLGTPSNLDPSTPGFLGASTGIIGMMYVFPTGLVLDPDIQYFVYQNALIPTGGITGGNTFSGGQAYATFLNGPVSTFFPQFTADNFSVSGTVVPEPSSLMVLVISLLGFGVLRRYRKNG